MSAAVDRAIADHLAHSAMAHDDGGTESLVEQALLPLQQRHRADGLPVDALPESWDVPEQSLAWPRPPEVLAAMRFGLWYGAMGGTCLGAGLVVVALEAWQWVATR